MDPLTILSFVSMGLKVLEAVSAKGGVLDVGLSALSNLTSKPAEEVTQADLDSAQTVLDSMIDEFNVPMPKPA